LEGPHVGGGVLQAPAEHPCPFDAQSSHLPPIVPHASDSVPKRQSPAAVQHPLQLDGAQGGATPSHVPFTVHAKPTAPQSRHCAACWPHALRSRPERHRCCASQQPSQFPGLQSGFVPLPPVPPLPAAPAAPPVPTVTGPVVALPDTVDEPVEPDVPTAPPAPVAAPDVDPVAGASIDASAGPRSNSSPVRPPHAAKLAAPTTKTARHARSRNRIGEIPAS
jgi:hypothetical protein